MQDRGRWLERQLATLARGRVLDVGCGSGRYLRHGDTGVDLDPARVRLARDRSQRVAVADAHALPFRDGSFDTVYAIRMLNDAGRIDVVLREVRRVLTPGGSLLVHTRARPGTGDRLDAENGEARLRAHFSSVRRLRGEAEADGVLFVATR